MYELTRNRFQMLSAYNNNEPTSTGRVMTLLYSNGRRWFSKSLALPIRPRFHQKCSIPQGIRLLGVHGETRGDESSFFHVRWPHICAAATLGNTSVARPGRTSTYSRVTVTSTVHS